MMVIDMNGKKTEQKCPRCGEFLYYDNDSWYCRKCNFEAFT